MERPARVEVGQRWLVTRDSEGHRAGDVLTIDEFDDDYIFKTDRCGMRDGYPCRHGTAYLDADSYAHAEYLGPTSPPKDEERCPCGNEWIAADEGRRRTWRCTHGADRTSDPYVCGKPIVVRCGSWHARCAEHAPKAFREGAVVSTVTTDRTIGEEELSAFTRSQEPTHAPAPPPKSIPDNCTVSTCRLGAACTTCNPRKPEPYVCSIDEYDLLRDA